MSDPAEYRQWLDVGFRWLTENWPEGQEWREVRPGFLDQLGVGEAQLTAPEYRVLALVVEQADQAPDPVETRRSMLDEHGQLALLTQAVTQAGLESAAGGGAGAQAGGGAYDPAAGAVDVEPQYVEGRGWMRYDPASGEWVDVEGGADAAGAEPAEQAADPAVAGEPQWIEGYGWMRWDAAAGEWVVVDDGAAEPGPESSTEPAAAAPGEAQGEPAGTTAPSVSDLPEDEQAVVAGAVEGSVAPVIAEVLSDLDADPEVDLSELSPEEIEQILAEVIAEAPAAQ